MRLIENIRVLWQNISYMFENLSEIKDSNDRKRINYSETQAQLFILGKQINAGQ